MAAARAPCPPATGFSSRLELETSHRSAARSSSASALPGRLRATAVSAGAVSSDSKQGKSRSPVVVIDNYDSFTYNICQYLGDLGCEFVVYRNDEISVQALKSKRPRGILISPGPGTPQDSGISLQTVKELGPSIPLFGVCMGLQCIGEAFGGKIVRAPNGVMHGKVSSVYYDEKGEPGIFSGLPNPFTACRYHSLVIERETFPGDELEITAWTDDGLIMGVRHRKYKHIQAVQFHPESIITQNGKQILENYTRLMNLQESRVEDEEPFLAGRRGGTGA
ncbi:anthranilate synthase beta subunit 2, chloroplastic [Selaginella moellendorffii]|uniref:anthranilate synthase beta subunit 2, chloroplastic n=1 Tax=Selaginella moellendorffii TaxID=88036 RepID=UPI000D1CC5D4|nr:anthranilate synthase beta subunit 2, chloroplastic [Selaginella moellendorffii]|eukprot:XP_002981612.2 anthranilate synthase beta subunit 2, chloroplastic [Selaginella moellendorffii]